MSERKPYPSDLSDEQWSLIEPVITAWKDRHRSVSGHQGAYDMREIVNAILHQGRTGCQWAYLPHDLPQKSATYYSSPPGGTTGPTRSFMNSCAARSGSTPAD
ncbi:transposase [Streptomyces olindensis]|uniref:transposase n=1 Tax=Streptomyces olindensis TaxID=358823 RepID=UPI003F4D2D01